MNDPVLELKNVVKFYSGDKPVLNGVSFRLYRGETKIIIGESGSGKSVTIQCIVGLEEPDSGEVLYDGRNFTTMALKERNVVFEFVLGLTQGGGRTLLIKGLRHCVLCLG